MRLTDIARDTKVKIIDLASVNELVLHRLNDFGIMEGSVISLRKVLPFGGPCMIETKGQWIAIRRKEAVCIQVEAV
ncbi:iron transporter FeoA [Paenibacillus tyrfis]|uniref:FeoA family protein n=1 Tax=Paenibacillus TaxID=44249 RepID=UPI0024935445|nr:FeoA family protein [Paenibacillus tyrfis]GLI09128.1 iron transporter FeoA [Paenibacillus tyrfis]GMX67314.1 ferrous iron transport protein A [Paenibacillus elgii]